MFRQLIISILSILIMLFYVNAEAQKQPSQPQTGYGGSEYKHGNVIIEKGGSEEKSFFIYIPSDPEPQSAGIVLFNHGYGAVNPALYGAWIKHLVRKGNIIIYPRYQKTLLSSPATYTPNSAGAFTEALKILKQKYPGIITDKGYVIIGHSYGGVITTNEAYNYKKLGLPELKAAMICAPGTGGHDKGRYSSYKEMNPEIPIIIISEKEDEMVGDAFSKELYNSLSADSRKIWYAHQPDSHGKEKITAFHSECVSIDKIFDTGEGGRRVKKRLESETPNSTDFYFYWKLADAITDAAFRTNDFSKILTGSPDMRYAGEWSDGIKIKEPEVKSDQKSRK